MTDTNLHQGALSAGRLTTHVLDTMNGRPACGMAIELFAWRDEAWQLIKQVHTNDDGRVDAPMLSGETFQPGRYRLVFDVEGYFRAQGAVLPEPAFLGKVPLDFGMAQPTHYHVPLLVSPWAYSTYRGS